ncbi:SCO family protein [Actinoallomurus sp. CA-150999]|uniref:SCO family protein n=1 Tax=Actinoallomurus sp. CA-150999 TaxID=3239887 RepID=UPI003D8A614A
MRTAHIRPGARRAGRRRRMLALACLVPFVLAACGTGTGTDRPPVKISAPTSDLHGTRIGTPLREPDLTLTGTTGRPVNLIKATQGKLTLVYFGYTHCPDVCPTTMADLAGALRLLTPEQRARIAVVFITTDPWRDTPKVIKAWLASFNPSFIGLTGDYTKIQTAAKSLGIALERPSSMSGEYEVTHGAQVLPFGGDHRAHVIYTAGVSAKEFAADLPKLLQEDDG